MKRFQQVMFIVAYTFVCVHIVGHIYTLWCEPKTSVLDSYGETIDVGIREASSLSELQDQYAVAHRKLKAYEKELEGKKQEKSNKAEPFRSDYDREKEPYKSEIKLRNAIEEWEDKSREIVKTRVYWLFGLAFLIGGLCLYKYGNRWIGVASLVVAFSEMIYWASPSYFSGRSLEYERLIQNKLVIALLSVILLVIASHLTGTIADSKEEASS